MEENQFAAIMPGICAGLADLIAEKKQLDEQSAISALYASMLYTYLEDEESKVWHYSIPMLYQLWEQGETTGNIDFPEP